jgi:hypothetical protein
MKWRNNSSGGGGVGGGGGGGGGGELTVNEPVYIFTCCFAECKLGLCLLRKDIDGGY